MSFVATKALAATWRSSVQPTDILPQKKNLQKVRKNNGQTLSLGP